MRSVPLTLFMACFCWLVTVELHAVQKPKPFTEAAAELIRWIESIDASTNSQKDEWTRIRTALETAGREAESPAGFKLSVSRILDHWNGKSFRVLDNADLQTWALQRNDAAFPDSGAIFQSRGNKWTVQYVGRFGQNLLRRGDEVKTPGFHPILSSERSKTISLELQSNPMSPPKKLELPIHPQPFSAYVLAETQAAGTVVSQDKNRICLQKAWFWLNDAVNAHLVSRLNFQAENCAAQLIDLRDSFGLEPSGTLLTSRKIPTVVLINQQTREGAARFARRLKTELHAHVLGEQSAQTVLPEQQQVLKTLPWTVIAYAGRGQPVDPDAIAKDSLLYAEGLDSVREQGLQWIREQLKK